MKNSSKLLSKLLVFILTVTLLGSSLVAFTACDEVSVGHKKAIIIVTALLSGGLYDSETGEAVWDPLPYDLGVYDFLDENKLNDSIEVIVSDKEAFRETMGILAAILTNKKDSSNLLWNLALNQYGEPNNPNLLPANGYDGKIQYGVLKVYKDNFDALTAKYPDYEVKMFNYDWRLDNVDNSRKLEEFINENGYDEVVLTSHSMGACVVAGYLARSEANREKVKSYCSYAGAFLGSLDALTYLEDVFKLIEGFDLGSISAGNSSLDTVISSVMSQVDTLLEEQAKPFLRNMTSIIQLLPSWEYLASPQYADGSAGITVDGVAISSKDELYRFYESREWAWLADDDGNWLFEADGTTHKIKPYVKSLRAFHDSLYVDVDGKPVISTNLVNTTYFCGDNVKTKVGLDFYTDGTPFVIRTSNVGDGTVPYYSTTAGNSKDAINAAQNQKLLEFVDSETAHGDHLAVGCEWKLIENGTYEAFDNQFSTDITWVVIVCTVVPVCIAGIAVLLIIIKRRNADVKKTVISSDIDETAGVSESFDSTDESNFEE